MEPTEEAASWTGRERRSQVRYPVDGEASLLPLNGHPLLRCRLVDLSLQGCCIRGQQPMRVAAGTRVEVQFKVNGINFRFSGTIQWSDGRQQVGIRFPNSLPRQAEDWKAVLAEVEATARKKAAEEHGESKNLMPSQCPREPKSCFGSGCPAAGGVWRAGLSCVGALPFPPPGAGGSSRDRRAQARESVDSPATLYLVKSGSRFDGRIVDLSLGGCGIRIKERFPLGIYTRVEVEFRLQGLPFRLAGVVQTIRDQTTVGIRFIDLSERKQAQVIELIAEIRALQESKPEHAVPPAS